MPLHHPRTRRVLVLIAVLLLTFAASCSDDSSDDRSRPDGDTAADEDRGAGDIPGSCDGTAARGSSPGTGSFTASSAAGVSLEGGKAYTIYLADFEVTTDDVSAFSTPTVPDGGTMFIVAVTVFNAPDVDAIEPIAAGQVIEYTSEWEVLTFVVTATDGSVTHSLSSGADGSLTVTAVGETFCGTIDYVDGEKSLSGTFEAPITSV
jgi:hypothetical protein